MQRYKELIFVTQVSVKNQVASFQQTDDYLNRELKWYVLLNFGIYIHIIKQTKQERLPTYWKAHKIKWIKFYYKRPRQVLAI